MSRLKILAGDMKRMGSERKILCKFKYRLIKPMALECFLEFEVELYK